MKKIMSIGIMLAVLLGLGAPGALAATGEEAFALMESLYQKHAGMHTFAVLQTDEQTGEGLMYGTNGGTPDALLACAEYRLTEAHAVPSYAAQISELFLELFVAAQSASATVEGVNAFDIERFSQAYDANVSLKVLGNEWWEKHTQDGVTMLVGPLLLTDARGEVIDDTIHVMCAFFAEEGTRVWVFHDAELVTEFFRGMNLQPADNGANARFIKAWVSDMEAYYDGAAQEKDIDDLLPATPGGEAAGAEMPPRGPAAAARAEAERQAWLDSLVVIGTARVTNSSVVNLRDERGADGALKGKAQPGETFDVVGANEANGWWEIILGRDTAFISPKLVEFTGTPEYIREQEALAAAEAEALAREQAEAEAAKAVDAESTAEAEKILKPAD